MKPTRIVRGDLYLGMVSLDKSNNSVRLSVEFRDKTTGQQLKVQTGQIQGGVIELVPGQVFIIQNVRFVLTPKETINGNDGNTPSGGGSSPSAA